MSSSRHWNVQRNIQRQHRTKGEPVSYDTEYYQHRNPQNFPLPLAFPTSKEKPHKNFSNVLEHQFLEPIRKVVELKNLLSQLSTIQPKQQRIMSAGGGGGVYPHTPSMTFDSGESNSYLSEEYILDNESDYEIVGYRGHVCTKCSTINIDTIFHHKDGKSGQVETTHTCNSKRLADAQLEPNKDKTINDLYEKLPIVEEKGELLDRKLCLFGSY
jgi:hypothetical protein